MKTILITVLSLLLFLQSPSVWNQLGKGPMTQTRFIIPGMIVLVDTGSCPAGWSEISQTGNHVMFTTSGNGDVGTTGGTNSYTPVGTVSAPIFSGAALATHAHELPIQIPSTTTTRQLAAATFGTGTSRAATAVSGTGTSNTTSAAVALSQAVSAGTPAGTNSIPTFTGVQANIQPTYVKLIGCKKL